MQTLGIILIVVGAMGLALTAISRFLMDSRWPAAGKVSGLLLGLAIVGGILWIASPSPAEVHPAGGK